MTLRRLNFLLIGIAALVLVFTLSGVEWGELGRLLVRGAIYLPLLLLPYAATSLLWALSWRVLLQGDSRPSLARLFVLRLGGESLNQLTPAATFGGEPFKAAGLMQAGIAWPDAVASLAIQKALLVVSLVLYIVFAIFLVPVVLPEAPAWIVISCSAATLLLAGGGGAFLYLQRRHPCSACASLLKRSRLGKAFIEKHGEGLDQLDLTLSEFYRSHARQALLSLGLILLGWAMHAVEVSLIFSLLEAPIDFEVALCLDGLSQLAAALGFLIPASLGVQDGGNVMLSLGFELGATLGAAFSVLRRFREAVWLVLGLLAVAVIQRAAIAPQRRK